MNNFDTYERILPEAVDAEQAVLGAMLLDNQAIGKAVELLDETCFYDTSHRQIFQAVCALWERSEAADQITVAEELHKRGQLEKAGGVLRLAQLAGEVATSANIEYHAKIVLEKALLRKQITIYGQGQEQCYGGAGSQEPMEWVNHELRKLEKKQQGDFVASANLLKRWKRGEFIPSLQLAFPLPGLNRLTGGLEGGKLYVMGALKKSGKSKFVIFCIGHLVKQGKRVALFSLEMGEATVIRWLISTLTDKQIPKNKVPEEVVETPEYFKAEELLLQDYLVLNSTPGLSVSQLCLGMERAVRACGADVIFIDPVQGIDFGGGTENRATAIQIGTQRLRDTAKRLNVPLFMTAQLPKSCEGRYAHLGDLKESGGIEENADVIMMLNNINRIENVRDAKKTIKVEIDLFQRDGESGIVSCIFVPERSRLKELLKQGGDG